MSSIPPMAYAGGGHRERGSEQNSSVFTKVGAFLPKLRRTLSPDLVRYYMELLCSGREALAVYTESKKVLDQQLPVSSLESALKSSEVDEEYDLLNSLNCHRCNGLIMDPVCLPCGHCLCKTCVEKAAVAVGVMRKRQVECPSCKQRWACQSGQGNSNRNSNVLLSKIWNESFPKRRKAYEYKEDGNKFATEKDFPLAIDSYTLALTEGLCVCMHVYFMTAPFAACDQLKGWPLDALDNLYCQRRPFSPLMHRLWLMLSIQ